MQIIVKAQNKKIKHFKMKTEKTFNYAHSNNPFFEVLVETPSLNFEDLFNQHNAAHYNEVIDKSKKMVLKFLNQNKKPFYGVSPKELLKEFSSIHIDIPIKDFDRQLIHGMETADSITIASHKYFFNQLAEVLSLFEIWKSYDC